MNANPWDVESVQAFAFLNCPECTFKSKHEDFFQEHAEKSHPMSSVLFKNRNVLVEVFDEQSDEFNEYKIEVKDELIIPYNAEHAYAMPINQDKTVDIFSPSN